MSAAIKKIKTEFNAPIEAKSASISRLFQPFRATGHVTTSVPPSLQMRGSEYFAAVALSNCFQIFDLQNLRLKLVSQAIDTDISGLVAHNDTTYVSTGARILQFHRAKCVGEMKKDEGASSLIIQMLLFGQHLLSLHEDGRLCIWDTSTHELYTELHFDRHFEACVLFHPATYLNKILVGGRDGRMQLWNIKSRKLIYEFNSGFGAAVSCIAQSPVVDVVAVGLSNGKIILHHLKQDETLFSFQQEGRVTAISFRTDDQPIMATSNASGDIALWNLDERRLTFTMNCAHEGQVTYLEFLNGKPIVFTSGSDNAIKEWIFDGLDGLPRLLRSRSGHHAPPTCVRYYDEDGRFLLSAGRDRAMRMFSVFRDEQNVELSQGASLAKKAKVLNKSVDELKLPFPVQFASATTRERDWDNVVSCHLNTNVARTWSFERKAIGKHILKSKDGSDIKVCPRFVWYLTLECRRWP